MKIDFIIGALDSGGAQRVVSSLANYFAENGKDVRIITFREGDHFDLHPSIERLRIYKKLPVFNYTIPKAFLFFLKFYSKKKNRPDVISSHIDLMGLATIPVAKLYNIKLIHSEHFNHFNRKIGIAKKILRYGFYRFPDTLTVLTKFDIPYFKNKTKRVEVMLNPSSFEPIADLKAPREKVILAVGDLDRYNHKGFDNLLDIANEVLPLNPNWKLKIIGQGEIGLKHLKNKVKNSIVKDQIIFTGYRSDVREMMTKSEVFILSSRHEGLPMVLIEAMSQGMSCISYDCISGPSDIITNGKDGILVKDQDKAEMISALNNLLKDEPLRQKLRENTPSSLHKFAIEEIGSQWDTLIKELLSNK